jgi:hypothetical protein
MREGEGHVFIIRQGARDKGPRDKKTGKEGKREKGK